MDYEKLGRRIREYRTKINLTQEYVAEAVGISAVFMSQLENGNRKPSLETVFNISNILNVPMDYLMKDSVIETDSSKMDELIALLKGRPEEEIAIVADTAREILRHVKGKLS
ncbi:helix-turn-helix domain-containing protein [Ruminiclostridium cellobioparum]|uniref:helix-turn-helix domain-containing protein n=1 Tax=Ruminiclostridium cellobioparum TaxID=29355 RepID=UPI0028AAAA0F|nr:helix-turn-helix transcriptional regulator [Ruminiclostridium cellobioparum]